MVQASTFQMEKYKFVNVITVLYKVQRLPALPTPNWLTQFENHVQQMSSASTFAHNVVEVLQEINQLKWSVFNCSLPVSLLGVG
jgi:hypothetical protein